MSTVREEKTDDEIWALLCRQFPKSHIQQVLGVSQQRIADVIWSHQTGQKISHVRGPPRRITPEIRNRVVELTLANPNWGDRRVGQVVTQELGIQIGRSTVNEIRHDTAFYFKPPKKMQALTEEQIQNRCQFLIDWDGPMFRPFRDIPFIFSDESRFCQRPDTRWVWRRRGQYDPKIFAPTDKFPKFAIMVWGAIGPNFKSKLVIIAGNIDSEKYISMLKEAKFFEEADAVFGRGHYVFMQDGAPCHTSEASLAALREWCQLLPYWPANSCDLNPIEMLWGIIKRKLNWAEVKTLGEAIQIIMDAWNAIPMAVINALCGSFDERLQMMRDLGGASIQPFLSAHMHRIADSLKRPPNYLHPDAKGMWTADEDRLLLDRHAQIGSRWKRLARFFPGRTPGVLKNRWNRLTNAHLSPLDDDDTLKSGADGVIESGSAV
jgi:transposase